MAKVVQRQIQAPLSSCSGGNWQPTWGFQGTEWPYLTGERFLSVNHLFPSSYDYGTIHFWNLIIYFILSENEHIKPFPEERRKPRTLGRKNGEKNL